MVVLDPLVREEALSLLSVPDRNPSIRRFESCTISLISLMVSRYFSVTERFSTLKMIV